jgi:hypothetical protein
MMFGREVFQPLDVTLGTLKIDPPKKGVPQYIKELVDNLALGKITIQQERILKLNNNGKRVCIT